MNVTPDPPTTVARRTRAGALWLIAFPPVAGATLVVAFLFAESMGARPLAGEPANVSEAAATGAAARALQFIANGENPNDTWLIAAGTLDSSAHQVTAIDGAILGRRPEMIPLLREHGATIVNAGRSTCLAHAIDLPEALPLIGVPADNAKRDPSVAAGDAIRACLE